MRAPVLVAVVIGLHVVAVGAMLFLPGCQSTPRPAGPPPAPVMPPKAEVEPLPMVQPRPVFHTPSPIRPAMTPVEGIGAKTYVVQKGDVLSKIASKVGVSSREIIELNKLKDPNRIVVGQSLILPDYANVSGQAAPQRAAPAPTPTPAAKPTLTGTEGTHVVQSGNTLSGIASTYGVTVADLKAANNLKNDKILIGQKLTIPGTSAAAKPKKEAKSAPKEEKKPAVLADEPDFLAPMPPPAASAEPVLIAQDAALEYTVIEGDTVDDIAKVFLISREDILKANNLPPDADLRSGQVLKIPSSLP